MRCARLPCAEKRTLDDARRNGKLNAASMKAGLAFWVIAQLVACQFALAQEWMLTSAPSTGWVCAASSADGTKLAAVSYYDGVYLSTNSGRTWTSKRLAGSGNFNAITSSADGSRLALVRSSGGIYTSSNSGATWTLTSAPSYNRWISIASSADGTKLAALEYEGGIHISTNSGLTWLLTSAPNTNWWRIASSEDGTTLVAGCLTGPLYVSTNSAAAWTRAIVPWDTTHAPAENWQSVACSANGQTLVAAGVGWIFVSTNIGATWTSANGAGITGAGALAASRDCSRLMAFSLSTSTIRRSTNSGGTWTSTAVPQQYWMSLASSADGSKYVAVAQNGPIYVWPSPPKLSVSRTNLVSQRQTDQVIRLIWPFWAGNFVLEQNADLGSATWSAVTNLPTLVTNKQTAEVSYQTSLTNVTGQNFYRLVAP